MSYSQADRMCRVISPLGDDTPLLLQQMSGRESISSLFSYSLTLVSETEDVNFQKIVGKPIGISVRLEDGRTRWFHGIVARFVQGSSRDHFTAYRAVVVPWLWFLTRRANCKIFRNKSVPEIVKAIFDDLKFSDYKLEITGTHPKRDYTVQYRETDFQFISRLLEDEGIAYYFEHEEKSHTLVLFDAPTGNPPCPIQPVMVYESASDQGMPSGDVRNMFFERELRPGAHTATDFNFEQPSVSLLSDVASQQCIGSNPKLEIYDYPGNFALLPEGGTQVRRLMEVEECASVRVRGESQRPGLNPGYRFTLKGHYRKDCNEAYLVTEVVHTVTEIVGTGVGAMMYQNTFACIPHRIPFRPLRRTPRPIIHGAQTATVVGEPGKEIDVDKHGRVIVRFHWDRREERNRDSSCRVRVAQNWAGKGWGLIAHPRVGQEVIVEFLEGDPDRPIVTGRVYNAEQIPPYALPAKDTQSGIKSRSSPGGNPSNFNELRFEDKKGAEEVFIQAEKDLNALIKNDETRTIHQNQTITLLHGNRTITLNDGDNHLTAQKGDISVRAPAGLHSTDAVNIILDATSSIKLKCGASTIEMTPAMITINAPLVKIN
jgi:type VI secretion system secreted protein VgrG